MATIKLTGRQHEVAELVAHGYTDKEIGQQLGIAYSTVRAHFSAACSLLGLRGRAALIAWWYTERST